MSIGHDPSGLDWLLARAGETNDMPVFAYALLEHIAHATKAELTGLLLIDSTDRELFHFAVSPLTPVELAGLRARISGLADVDPNRVLLHNFRLRSAAGTLYAEPVTEDCREAALSAAAAPLALLDIVAGLAEAREEASRDALTGLLNRRSLAEGLGAVIEQGNRYGASFSLAMIDLDNFKWFNDTFGHSEGDLLLKQMALVLTSSLRRADIVARYGGDEFLLVLPHTDPEKSETLLKRVGAELDQFLHRYGSVGVRLGFSAGVSHFPADGRDADALIRRADERLYVNKAERAS